MTVIAPITTRLARGATGFVLAKKQFDGTLRAARVLLADKKPTAE